MLLIVQGGFVRAKKKKRFINRASSILMYFNCSSMCRNIEVCFFYGLDFFSLFKISYFFFALLTLVLFRMVVFLHNESQDFATVIFHL